MIFDIIPLRMLILKSQTLKKIQSYQLPFSNKGIYVIKKFFQFSGQLLK